MSIRKGDSIIAGMPNDLLASKADNLAFTGATSLSSGVMGLVPAPTSNEQYSFLCGDGTWSDPFVPDLFDFKWSDHELNNMSWVRSDPFSWLAGTVYQAAYNHLVDDFDSVTKIWTVESYGDVYVRDVDAGDHTSYAHPYTFTKVGTNTHMWATTETPEVGDFLYSAYGSSATTTAITAARNEPVASTETIAGTTITYYRASDGHKIVLADQETNVASIFSSTGVAWYYILDTTNIRFKLPRSMYGFMGFRGDVSNYIAPGLPNITGVLGQGDCAAGTYNISRSGAFYATNTNSRSMIYDRLNVTNTYGDNGFDASRSNSIYGSSTTVQPPATQMYLYFYVGQFTQTALQNTAGLNAELFNNKADLDIFNLLYPVGAVYIGIQSICPLASIIPGSTWSKIEGRYLLASGTIAGSSEYSSAGSYISAGLPNITGSFHSAGIEGSTQYTGAFSSDGKFSTTFTHNSTSGTAVNGFNFDASRSSSIYGNSSTVRPAAYSVNVWVRTA